MEIKLIEVFNNSEPKNEYVWLSVTANTNLKYFMVWDNTYDENGDLSNKHQYLYKFPDFHLIKGDFVALYTNLAKEKNLGFTHHLNEIYTCLTGI